LTQPSTKRPHEGEIDYWDSVDPSWAVAAVVWTAASFAVPAGQTVTNTGPSVIAGGIGLSPGSYPETPAAERARCASFCVQSIRRMGTEFYVSPLTDSRSMS
jgi:hypothetical protein